MPVAPVVLLRHPRPDANGNDPYKQALADIGVSATCKPVLAFDILQPPTLHVLLNRAERYDALVCTSPRAVEALQRALPSTHDRYAGWTEKPTYVVGPRTAEAVAAWGGKPRGAQSGDAKTLAECIRRDAPGPLLFLSGNRRRETLPQAFVAAAQIFDEVEVYRTRTRRDVVLPDPPAYLTFFSPSGIEAVLASGYDLASYRCAAIGPTTADALREHGTTVEAVAHEPSPRGLATVFQTARIGAS